MRIALVLVALVGLLVLAGLGYVVFGGVDAPPSDVPDPVAPTSAEDELETSDMTALDQRRHVMQGEYPFGEFADVFAELRRPVAADAPTSPRAIQAHISKVLYDDLRFTIRREGITYSDVVEILRPKIEAAGIKVFTLDKPMPDDRFDLFLTDKDGWEVIAELERISKGEVTYRMTIEGLCIGTKDTCYEFAIRSRKEHNRRESEKYANEEVMEMPVAPEFEDAHIGDVVKQLTAQTAVPIIVGPDVWSRKKLLTWRSKERPLRDVLNRICRHLDCGYRVRDQRIFLISD